jgi:SNF2 family DNA or RNA helicase
MSYVRLKNRSCGVRVSKSHPDAFSKPELVKLAISDLGIKESIANKLTMLELCKRLGGRESPRARSPRASPPRTSPRKSKRLIMQSLRPGERINRDQSPPPVRRSSPVPQRVQKIDETKKCSSKRIKGVNRFSRDELEKYVLSMGILARSEVKKMKYEELCKELNLNIENQQPIKAVKNKQPSSQVLRKDDKQPIIKPRLDCISRSKKPLKDHQKIVNKYMKKNRGLIVIHSVGSGKTLTAVTAAQCFLDENPDCEVYVITPTSLQENFKDEVTSAGFNVNDPRLKFFTFQGFVNAKKDKKIKCGPKSMIIIDEAHNLRNSEDSVRVEEILECTASAKKVLLLTATPLINRSHDIEALVAMVDGTTKTLNRDAFEAKYQEPEQVNSAFIKKFGCKVSFFSPDISDREQDYPLKIEKDEYFPMSSDYLRKYRALEDSNLAELPGGLQSVFDYDPTAFYTGLRIGSNNLDNDKGPKFNYIIDHIKKNPKHKFVIFSHWLEGGSEIIKKMLEKERIKYVVIDGTMTKKKRDQAVKKYNSDIKQVVTKGVIKTVVDNPSTRVLIISKAGGEGLDLKRTRGIFLVDPGWHESGAEQVIGRAIRYKSHDLLPQAERKVDVIRLYSVKPNEYELIESFGSPEEAIPNAEEATEAPSVDLFLKVFAIKKQNEINKFLEKLKKVSIEEREC